MTGDPSIHGVYAGHTFPLYVRVAALPRDRPSLDLGHLDVAAPRFHARILRQQMSSTMQAWLNLASFYPRGRF